MTRLSPLTNISYIIDDIFLDSSKRQIVCTHAIVWQAGSRTIPLRFLPTDWIGKVCTCRRNRSRSPVFRPRSRSRSPVGRARSRSRSPVRRMRTKSRSPINRRRTRSRSPVTRRRTRSRSPINRRRSRSRSPINRRRSRSRSPINRRRSRSRSPSPAKPRSRSNVRSRSRSPVRSKSRYERDAVSEGSTFPWEQIRCQWFWALVEMCFLWSAWVTVNALVHFRLCFVISEEKLQSLDSQLRCFVFSVHAIICKQENLYWSMFSLSRLQQGLMFLDLFSEHWSIIMDCLFSHDWFAVWFQRKNSSSVLAAFHDSSLNIRFTVTSFLMRCLRLSTPRPF